MGWGGNFLHPTFAWGFIFLRAFLPRLGKHTSIIASLQFKIGGS